jgi:hypothetical protein
VTKHNTSATANLAEYPQYRVHTLWIAIPLNVAILQSVLGWRTLRKDFLVHINVQRKRSKKHVLASFSAVCSGFLDVAATNITVQSTQQQVV